MPASARMQTHLRHRMKSKNYLDLVTKMRLKSNVGKKGEPELLQVSSFRSQATSPLG